MSAINCFDIRNFSKHVSHLSISGKSIMIYKVIKDIFISLDKAIKKSREKFAIEEQTFVNHTGDGFVAIFYGNGKFIQCLFVASLIANDVQKIFRKYKTLANNVPGINLVSPLDFGIGIDLGPVGKFKYHQEYPGGPSVYGLLGNRINLCNRVQESTKDHTFPVICTGRVFKNAISVIKKTNRKTIKDYFNKLGLHMLRGMEKPVPLYGVEIGFAKKIEPNMILN
jgi:class 3 adenylate cyclase